MPQERAEAAIALATEPGLSLVVTVGTSMRGWTLVRQVPQEAGLQQLRQGVAAEQATQCLVHLPYTLALLAEAYVLTGQQDAGLAAVAEGLRLAEAFGGHFNRAELYCLKGELLLLAEDGVPQAALAAATAW